MKFNMKKQNNKDSNNFPFVNEIKRAKYGFIKMIQFMPDDVFESFIFLFFDYLEHLDSFDDDLEEYFYDDEDEIFENEDLPF